MKRCNYGDMKKKTMFVFKNVCKNIAETNLLFFMLMLLMWRWKINKVILNIIDIKPDDVRKSLSHLLLLFFHCGNSVWEERV